MSLKKKKEWLNVPFEISLSFFDEKLCGLNVKKVLWFKVKCYGLLSDRLHLIHLSLLTDCIRIAKRNELWSLWPTKHYFDVKSVAYSNRNQSGFITRKLNVFPELEPPLINRWQGSQYMCAFCYLMHIQEFYTSLFCKDQAEINQGLGEKKKKKKSPDVSNFYHETLSVI